ncbi:nitroreductase family deazaflavin-dependent oxidoreductase [Rhodococcus qingshengii]|uniref:nitroreductase family deazaflavin-dependent oxidoreductase n=1 Tax=Rhodococcus qingshengii TaxID=334542 RepID=UPI003D0B1E2B
MKSALSEGLGTDDYGPDKRLHSLYTRWGRGGYGLVITGNIMVDRNHLGEPGNVVIEDDRHLDELSRWAKSCQDGGAPIWVQINHPGRQANPIATGTRPVAPSAIRPNIPSVGTPRALADTEILAIIDRFAQAAVVTETAGFNGIQVHAAHGYLVSQFLSPLSNDRDDNWGGSPTARTRFLADIIDAIRENVSPAFGVGVKVNSADFMRGGFSEADSRHVIERLVERSIDLIEISGGSYESPAMMGRPRTVAASTRMREAYFLDYAAAVRDIAGGTPIAVTGGFRTRSAMEAAIAGGLCNIVGIGRPAAINPESASQILAHDIDQLTSRPIKIAPFSTSKIPLAKSLEGALDLQWHTDQLHRLGAGKDPDPARPEIATAVSMIRRNGIDAIIRKRGNSSARSPEAARRKFKIERIVGRYLANPVVRLLNSVGLRTQLAAELKTVGRRSGIVRRVPVAASFDSDGAWVISQHGRRSGWAQNIAANSAVRIWYRDHWRTGIAELREDDDPVTRAATFSTSRMLTPLVVAGFRAAQSDPISVRITFTSVIDLRATHRSSSDLL